MLKFRGAWQGCKALIAELVAGELARAAGFPVPEIMFIQLDSELARTEPDPEIQDLIRASSGLSARAERNRFNLGREFSASLELRAPASSFETGRQGL